MGRPSQVGKRLPTLKALIENPYTPVLVELEELEQRIASRFARLEAKKAALAYIKGLISPVERKNSWQLAEAIGDKDPYRFQNLLNRASWDADAVRDDLRDYVVEHLGNDNAVHRKVGRAIANAVNEQVYQKA